MDRGIEIPVGHNVQYRRNNAPQLRIQRSVVPRRAVVLFCQVRLGQKSEDADGQFCTIEFPRATL
jgi:hypothetical protein